MKIFHSATLLQKSLGKTKIWKNHEKSSMYMRSGNRVQKPKLRRKYSEGFGGGSTWIMMSKMPGELIGQTLFLGK